MAVNKSSFSTIWLDDNIKIELGDSGLEDSYIVFDGTDLIFYDSSIGVEKSLSEIAASGITSTHDNSIVRVDSPNGLQDSEVYIDDDGQLYNAKSISSSVASDADFDTDEVLSTGLTYPAGIIMIVESTAEVTSIMRCDYNSIADVSSNAVFSTTKDTADKFNVYIESNELKIQNKVGDNKNISIAFYRAD